VRYSVLPARVILDKRVRKMGLLVLATLGLFFNKRNVAYPSLKTLGRLCHADPANICRWAKRLVEYGYLRRLEPRGRKHPNAFRHTNRYQLLVDANDPLPENEQPFSSTPAV